LQLVDGHTLFDYNVGLNEIIQILVRQSAAVADTNLAEKSEAVVEVSQLTTSENILV